MADSSNRLKDIFLKALDLSAPAERAAYVYQACGDPTIRTSLPVTDAAFWCSNTIPATGGFWLNDANTGKVPGSYMIDATVAYVRPRYEVRFNAQNLTDETYYVGGYQNNPNRVLPGSPRAYAVTLRYIF